MIGNAADVFHELALRGVIPDVVTDQTPAHDPLMYVPEMPLEEATSLRVSDSVEYQKQSMQAMAKHVRAMLAFQEKGSIVFDYGNNLRQRAYDAGVSNAFDYPGFVPAYVRPLFCEGKGPFRWVALSGDPQDIAVTDEHLAAILAPPYIAYGFRRRRRFSRVAVLLLLVFATYTLYGIRCDLGYCGPWFS